MLTAQQRIDVEIEIRRRELFLECQKKYANSLANFIRDAWHLVEPSAEYFHGWHIDAMCEHLEAVTRGEIKRLLINVPPGMMKSLLVGVFWPAWEWGVKRLANYRYICAAHSQMLAVRDNMRCRRLIMSDWYQDRFSHVKLTSDQNAKIKFENTQLGFREAVAAGSITGSRGDRVIIDDPLSVEDSYSETVRRSKELWFLEAVPSRLNKPKDSAIVVVMQRLHEDDTSGIILSKNLGYEHLCLPMRFDSARKCSTKIGFSDPRVSDGELLFPERFPTDEVDRLEHSLGKYGTAGQLQQTPEPRGGAIIRYEWIKVVNVLPPSFTYIVQSYDTAYKTGQDNDYSVGTTWGILNGNYYLINRIKDRWEYPELLLQIKLLSQRFQPNIILIEDKSSGQSLIQSLQREISRVKTVQVDKDKITRAHSVSHLFENGKIFIAQAPWTKDYIANLIKFPFGSHDDDVDSTTMALTHLEKITAQPMRQIRADVFTR